MTDQGKERRLAFAGSDAGYAATYAADPAAALVNALRAATDPADPAALGSERSTQLIFDRADTLRVAATDLRDIAANPTTGEAVRAAATQRANELDVLIGLADFVRAAHASSIPMPAMIDAPGAWATAHNPHANSQDLLRDPQDRTDETWELRDVVISVYPPLPPAEAPPPRSLLRRYTARTGLPLAGAASADAVFWQVNSIPVLDGVAMATLAALLVVGAPMFTARAIQLARNAPSRKTSAHLSEQIVQHTVLPALDDLQPIVTLTQDDMIVLAEHTPEHPLWRQVKALAVTHGTHITGADDAPAAATHAAMGFLAVVNASADDIATQQRLVPWLLLAVPLLSTYEEGTYDPDQPSTRERDIMRYLADTLLVTLEGPDRARQDAAEREAEHRRQVEAEARREELIARRAAILDTFPTSQPQDGDPQ